MQPVSHQTVKLGKGRHASPKDGVCVMELASMLAGEPFSDHPRCVCPVIGSFLRTYNDAIDDERRQDLYGYAAKVVGSTSSETVQQLRAYCLIDRVLELQRFRLTRFLFGRQLRKLAARSELSAVGSFAAQVIPRYDARTHANVLAAVDELLAVGAHDEPVPAAPAPALADCWS